MFKNVVVHDSLDEALGEEVRSVFRAVGREVGDSVLHDNLEHGCRGLKFIPGRVRLEHFYYCRSHTPDQRERGKRRGREETFIRSHTGYCVQAIHLFVGFQLKKSFMHKISKLSDTLFWSMTIFSTVTMKHGQSICHFCNEWAFTFMVCDPIQGLLWPPLHPPRARHSKQTNIM